jgi:threonine synthase
MKFVSTKGNRSSLTFTECLLKGLAEDGGLFVPEKMPRFDLSSGTLPGLKPDAPLSDFAGKLLEPFVAGSELENHLSDICADAFNFPTPLQVLKKASNTAILELFHGPTAAFKDVGARFLAQCMVRMNRPATIIVATSGDTGGAVAAAFAPHPSLKVVILYPKGKISLRQEKQLTTWGPTVRAFSVRGSFDDCQRVVKAALASSQLQKENQFVSANSISIGRLLPQMSYHAKSSLEYVRHFSKKPTVIVPTGNLGNAVAAMWAKRAGFPIDKIVLATNENRTIPSFFDSGKYAPGTTISTLANAMDVSAPNNFERMLALYPDLHFLKDDVRAVSVSDQEISRAIEYGERDYGHVFCPHTATAIVAKEKLQVEHALIVATAHPAKFESIVEPLIGRSVEIPPALAAVLNRPSVSVEIAPELDALAKELSR